MQKSVSPLEVFLPRVERARIAKAYSSRIVRRLAAFCFASLSRGRGRIPRAFREEAAALDRLERLLARWRRAEQLRPDCDQEEFPFMREVTLQSRRRWSDLLVSTPWGFRDRRSLARQLAIALEKVERDRREEKERRKKEGQLTADERAALRRALLAIGRGRRDDGVEILRRLLRSAA